jgi:hypothetical protein
MHRRIELQRAVRSRFRALVTMLGCKVMRFASPLRLHLLLVGILTAAVFCASAQEENTKESQAKGMPPRATPADYQTQGQAGAVAIGAEFMGHSVPTPEHTFSAEDYVVVEAGLFGTPGGQTTLARGDFSLRVNGKKVALSSEPYELVFKSLKDPEWQPPQTEETKKSSTSLNTGGGGQNDSAPPPPPKMPFPLRRAMEQQVQKAAMQEGDRPLPQAGLLFFTYRGKPENIKSLELIYSGAAGKATLTLQP